MRTLFQCNSLMVWELLSCLCRYGDWSFCRHFAVVIFCIAVLKLRICCTVFVMLAPSFGQFEVDHACRVICGVPSKGQVCACNNGALEPQDSGYTWLQLVPIMVANRANLEFATFQFMLLREDGSWTFHWLRILWPNLKFLKWRP